MPEKFSRFCQNTMKKFDYFFILGLKISEAIYPNIKAPDIPTAPAVKPPINKPKKPFSSTAFFTPSKRVLPKPKSGTDAPAPAKSIKLSYMPKKPRTEPVHTKRTIILPGIIFVLSIRI